jgi:DNA-binding PadR family transcriptional regulator
MDGLIGETKLSILRQLRSKPLHGYALAEKLDLSHGYVYTHLGELKEAGMIEVTEETDAKKIYQLTQRGEYLVKAFEE